jgi:asparagine synthase (glutamine-hydrolysing)
MCGINGILGTSGLDNPKAVVQRMNDRLAHRGPDAQGVAELDDLVLGHRRLSIIDLDEAANQPFTSYDGALTLVYNGEIYNYRELREQLGSYPFNTHSDTEVVLAAYRKWGVDCLHHFNGMFAFALWDNESKQLLLARDRMGIKPLYYTWQGHRLIFSSEVRSLLASELIPRKLDRHALVDYLRYQTVHAPRTLVENLEVLQPGHRIIVADGETRHERWWNMADQVQPVFAPRNELLKETRRLLTSSVELRMRADVPFGAFLSGGIDSSAVVGLMAEVSEQPVSTFSVTFNEREFSEAPYAELIAKRFKTDHHEIRLQPEQFKALIPDALAAMDHPSGDGPNTYVVSKVTKESGITMALSGLGGDELFAGYDIFKRSAELLDKRWVMSFPKFIRRFGGELYKNIRPSIASDKIVEILNEDYLELEYFYPYNRQVLNERLVARLTSSRVKSPNAVHQMLLEELDFKAPGFQLPFLSKVSLAEINSYLQNVLLRDTDQMSMAHTLEVRVPFLDHRLVQFALGVSDPERYPHTPKKLLTDSLGDLLPGEIIDRPKMGFTLPWAEWMKNDLATFCEDRLNRLGQREWIDASGVSTLWTRFTHNDPKVTWSRIWHLVVLEDWLQTNGFGEE